MMEQTRKRSKKRDAILAALRSTKEHPSAEMLYSWLKADMPDLSLGTVYRNLSLFMADGEIMSIGVVNGQERYDATTAPHTHFICESCGRVLDLDMEDSLAGLYRQVERRTRGSVRTHYLTFSGLCSECKRSKTAQ